MANCSRDLTDKQSELIRHNFDDGNYGKSRKYPVRTLVNVVFMFLKLAVNGECYLAISPQLHNCL